LTDRDQSCYVFKQSLLPVNLATAEVEVEAEVILLTDIELVTFAMVPGAPEALLGIEIDHALRVGQDLTVTPGDTIVRAVALRGEVILVALHVASLMMER
jgi:hypothetical protein